MQQHKTKRSLWATTAVGRLWLGWGKMSARQSKGCLEPHLAPSILRECEDITSPRNVPSTTLKESAKTLGCLFRSKEMTTETFGHFLALEDVSELIPGRIWSGESHRVLHCFVRIKERNTGRPQLMIQRSGSMLVVALAIADIHGVPVPGLP